MPSCKGPICCVPGCRSGHYKKDGWKNSLFKFPKDEAMKKKWLRNIKRDDFQPSKCSRICSLHFLPEFIKKTKVQKLDNGQTEEVPIKFPRLAKDALPTLYDFKDSKYSKCNSVLENPLPKRKTPAQRKIEIDNRHENEASSKIADLIQEDEISSFGEFKEKYKEHLIEP